ncbi:sugar phosphate isomerase/epimerase [Candidatus Woesearchaeota archaeon]|nr:sugar phosphate isomerase/epimerase [Candidatus Woesearchaeota archaeon]
MEDTFTNTYRTNNEREFYVEGGLLGATTSPQTANQIQEASSRLNAGVKHIELELISPELFDAVPKQHFEEMKRMSELTGANINIHAPAQMDLAGFSKEGWSETERMKVEESMKHMLDRGADLGKNTVVNFHSSGGVPAFEWQKEKLIGEELPPEHKRKMFVIDKVDPRHQIMPLEYEEKEYFGGKEIWDPERRRRNINQTQWGQEKLQLFNYEKEKAEINNRLGMISAQIAPLEAGNKEGVLTDDEKIRFDNYKRNISVMNDHIEQLDSHMESQLQDIHDKFVRFTPEKQRKIFEAEHAKEYNELIKLSKKETEERKKLQDSFSKKQVDVFEKYNRDSKKAGPELQKITKEFKEKIEEIEVDRQRLLNIIQKMPAPERFVSTDEFSKDKISDTVANSAFYAYNEYKDKAPIVSVENVFPDWTLGRAESLREAVEKSREKFARQLVDKKGMSKSKAEEVSKKLIGATWDVGHITQLRKFGYSDKDIAEEAKKIAPVVKHIHVTDNFGFSDSHLAPGQGTVPIKEQLEKLKQGLGKEYDKVAHIVESGGFASQFKTSPRMQELQYFDSPLYEHQAGPYWKEIAYTHAEYNMGYGIMFPEKHFEMYGSGFSNLPQELGGQVSGDKSRFAGTPNQ